MLLLFCFFVGIISIINGQQGTFLPPRPPRPPVSQNQQFIPMGRQNLPMNINNQFQSPAAFRIPFPQCLSTEKASTLLTPSMIQNIFQAKLQDEESKLKQERTINDQLNNRDIMDFDAVQLRADTRNGALVARTATKVAVELMNQLGCETNSSITRQLDNFLRQIRIPDNMCAFDPNANCDKFIQYRTITGVCNNLQHPYDGSSQTAYARLLPAAYDDGISKPRSKSVLGGPLPTCRQISLTMGSKPVFDATYNSHFVGYGQFIIHDIILSIPVTDAGRTPITSCTCSTDDPDRCTVMDVPANDPFMAGQQCMVMPATAQAFTEQQCTLGVKDQINGNSHYIDLSVTYGSTKNTAHGLRTGAHGLLKSSTHPWSKFELPPGQREASSCVDGTETQRCFAGGDSRIMENMILSGLQAQWLRLHNVFSRELENLRSDWKNNDLVLYEESKKILAALHQRYTYVDWLPMLIGKKASDQFFGDNGLFSRYNPNMPGVIFNEASSAVLRLHTFVRDLYSRCKPNGQLIDQVWFKDINSRCKLAYDEKNNGVDAFLCGSFFDFGFAGDTNYAQQIHHHLFESTNAQGQTRRNDIVSINICRGREHGIPGYNAYRELCGMRRAQTIEELADTMSIESVQNLAQIYQHPDDIDLFVGINHEKHLPDALVGPTSACIIGTQFQRLKYGDRFFYTHEGQFTPEQLNSVQKYTYDCFVCHSTDIERVPLNPFKPPNTQTNPLRLCSECPIFDFNPWRLNTRKI